MIKNKLAYISSLSISMVFKDLWKTNILLYIYYNTQYRNYVLTSLRGVTLHKKKKPVN